MKVIKKGVEKTKYSVAFTPMDVLERVDAELSKFNKEISSYYSRRCERYTT